MLKRIPRQVFAFSLYSYLIVALAIVSAALLLLNADTLGVGEVALVVLLSAGLIGGWWLFHPRLTLNAPRTADDILRESGAAGKHTLLAFESEYCGLCMSIGRRVGQLEDNPDLSVIRVSVNSEPGMSLFRKYDGRMTPTYILLDPAGKVLQEWVLALPIERIRFAIERKSAA